MLVGANAWARPMLCAMAARGGSCVGERNGDKDAEILALRQSVECFMSINMPHELRG